MLKFEEMFLKGILKYNEEHRNIPDQYSIMKEWESFLEESRRFLEKTKNRKPIVDFKVRDELKLKYDKL